MKTRSFLSIFLVAALSLFLAGCYIDNEPAYDPALRVVGSYWVEEYSHTFDEFTEFEIRVYQNGTSRVVITNFYGADLDVNASVSGNTIYIPFQVRNGYEVEGRGTFANGDLQLEYTVRDTYDSHWVRNVCDADAWMY
jgi:hypothetical protein